jgi:hypothetical protein
MIIMIFYNNKAEKEIKIFFFFYNHKKPWIDDMNTKF